MVLYADLLHSRSNEFCLPPLASAIDFEGVAAAVLDRSAGDVHWSTLLLFNLPWSHPAAFFPFGFDAVRFTTEPLPTQDLSRELEGIEEEWLTEYTNNPAVRITGPLVNEAFRAHARSCASCMRKIVQALWTGPQYRSLSGAWVNLTGLMDRVLPLADSAAELPETEWTKLGIRRIMEKCETAPVDENHAIIALPALWRPDARLLEPETTGIPELLTAVRSERAELHEIPWRRLEELVAELLRARGMKVHVTPRSADGGRDIIATGELIPGEPSVLAVEVKQKPVVGVQDLRAALWANRRFPALLFATSGRFTAGVLREKGREENGFRLLLKDGISLAQWIDSYVDSRAGARRR